MRERAWARDRALAVKLLDEVWPALLLGLVVGIGVLVWTLGDPDQPYGDPLRAGSTWPLMCLVPIAAWVGLTATGGSAARLGFMLARPVGRQRWLTVRLLAGLVAVVVIGIVVHGAAMLGGFEDVGPPVALVAGAVVGALSLGALAGAAAATETGAVGGTVVGVVVLVGPPTMLLDAYGVTWDVVSQVVWGWGWIWASVLVAIPIAPLWRIVAELPRRCPRRIGKSAALTGVAYGLVGVFGWPSIMNAATNPVLNQVVAIEGRGAGPRVLYTRTRDEVDGIAVLRPDGTVVALWGEGRRRDQIVMSWPSEDGRMLAVLLVPPDKRGREVVLFDLETGAHVRSPHYGAELRVEQWVDGQAAVVLCNRDYGARLFELSLERDGVVPVSRPSEAWGEPWDPHAFVRSGVGVKVVSSWGSSSLGGTHIGVTFEGAVTAAAPLGMFEGRVAASRWLDDEHVAVIVVATVDIADIADEDRERRKDSWVFVIRRDGEVVEDVRVEGTQLLEIEGPAHGPWRVLGRGGWLAWLDASGERGPVIHPYNLGSRRRPWLPHVLNDEGIHALEHDGRLTHLPPANARGHR